MGKEMTEPLPELLDRLERLLGEASPGPMEARHVHNSPRGVPIFHIYEDGEYLAAQDLTKEDAHVFAEAFNALPRLIRELRARLKEGG